MTEPRITVTEADRRAAWKSEYGEREPGMLLIQKWFREGGDAPLASLDRISLDRARARTMAAFEERVRCLGLAMIGAGASLAAESIVLIVGVSEQEAGRWIRRIPRDKNRDLAPTDDDIRELVLAGWEAKAP